MTTYYPKKIVLKRGKEITIRHLEPTDAEQYPRFSEQISKETAFTLHYPGQFTDIDFLKEKWTQAKNDAWQLELGGFDGERLVSHLSLYKPRPYHPYEKHVVQFGMRILKDYCSSGLGSSKLIIAEDVAKEMNVTRMQATVRTSNDIGIHFYQKHGYEIEGVKKFAIFINGNFENEFYLSKILD